MGCAVLCMQRLTSSRAQDAYLPTVIQGATFVVAQGTTLNPQQRPTTQRHNTPQLGLEPVPTYLHFCVVSPPAAHPTPTVPV